MKLLVTGGAGFIGSAVVRHFAGRSSVEVVNVDALTYAGNLDSLNSIAGAELQLHQSRYMRSAPDRPDFSRIPA